MNLKQLKYVDVLARLGSFSDAASELGISQPSLSQYIKKIEDEVGAPLFLRTNGRVRLTDAGFAYLNSGRQILEIEHQMKSRISDILSEKSGTLIVGAAPYRSAGMLPLICAGFKEKYPDFQIVVEEKVTKDLLESTAKGDYDVCLTVMPVDEFLFCHETIAEEELLLAVPKSYQSLNAKKTEGRRYNAIELKNISGQPFVSITESQVLQRTVLRIFKEYQIEVNPVITVKSLQAQINMVREGLGMAIVPSGIERFCSSDEVCFYSFIEDLPKRQVVAIWPRSRQNSKVVTDFIEQMKQIKW